MEREGCTPKDGYIFRRKDNLDDFSSELYIEVGLAVEDYYDEVPISVYDEYQKEQRAKMFEEMGGD